MLQKGLFAWLLLGVLMCGGAVLGKELPYYFPDGVIQTQDPVEQMAEYLRYMHAMDQCTQPLTENGVKRFFSTDSEIRFETNIVSTSSHTENPAHMTIVLDNHVRMGDGRIRVTTLCEQRFISEHELEVVLNDLSAVAQEAAALNQAYYAGVLSQVVGVIADTLKLKPSVVEEQLDTRVPGTDLTFREYWFVPKPSSVSDFIPRELHLGVTPTFPAGVLGVTWLNTGLVYYNPMARVADYLKGTPSVLQHEEVHANVNLQRFPFGDGIDLESVASIPEMLYPENKTDLFYHGYAQVFRQIVEHYFSFPFAEVRERVVRFDAGGNLWIDEDEYHKYFDELERAKAELQLAFQKVLAEYYSKQIWWMAFHSELGMDNAIFKVIMAANYDLTGLGGRGATMHVLSVHHDEIMEAAEKAFKEQKKGDDDKLVPTVNISSLHRRLYETLVPEEQRVVLEEYFRTHPEALSTLIQSPERAAGLLRTVVEHPQQGATP